MTAGPACLRKPLSCPLRTIRRQTLKLDENATPYSSTIELGLLTYVLLGFVANPYPVIQILTYHSLQACHTASYNDRRATTAAAVTGIIPKWTTC